MPMPTIPRCTVVFTPILSVIMSPWNDALVIYQYLDARHETKIEPFKDGVHINWYSAASSKMHQHGY